MSPADAERLNENLPLQAILNGGEERSRRVTATLTQGMQKVEG
jgi:hypothetical protein